MAKQLILAVLLASPIVAAQETETETETVDVPKEVMMLRLRDGSIRWGSILEHDPDGIRFTLLSNGGVARVPWSFVDPPLEEELRTRFGYVDVSSEELLIDAVRILLQDGQEVIGVIQSREGDNLLVKVSGNLQAIPKRRIKNIATGVRIAALEVYSRDEIYNQYAVNTLPDDAVGQLELARICERILDFSRAVQHYETTQELDPELEAQAVEFALAAARVKAEQQEQIDYLRAVDTLRKKKKFDLALEQLDAFRETFPDSPLFPDVNKKKVRLLTARDEAIKSLVHKRWFYWLDRLARDAARKLETYTEVLDYASEQLGEDIRERVLADVQRQISEGATGDNVTAFWVARDKVRYKRASYGLGTWLLGEDEARKGIDVKEDVEPKSEKDEERAALEEKIKRFLKNQEISRRSRSKKDQADDYDEFWRTYPVNGRAGWVRAYYVEHSGDMELGRNVVFANCGACAGSGVREIIYAGGGGSATGGAGTQLVKCPGCHSVGVVRKIRYR